MLGEPGAGPSLGCFELIKIHLGLQRPPWPTTRTIPVGPASKATFQSKRWSLKALYGNNRIRNFRYHWYSFVFENLYDQFQRIANFYFVCVAIVQVFTDTPVSPLTSILPLTFVMLLAMIKAGYEDFLRHRADREVNNIPIQIVGEDGQLVTKLAYEITVGDIVLQRANDVFPCDMVLLSTSETTGECYVTTASLDGETNLKKFNAVTATLGIDDPMGFAFNFKGKISCQQPVDDFYTFYGKITVDMNDFKSTEPLSHECLLLRGARLRNTDFVYAVAVYTGPDTKMSLNSKGKQTKYSQIERKLNVFLVVFLALLVLTSAYCESNAYKMRLDDSWFVQLHNVSVWQAVQSNLGFIILFNFIIPISLYVTIELIKFFGSGFFMQDLQMYDAENDVAALANTSDIIEELGQVRIALMSFPCTVHLRMITKRETSRV